MYFAFLLLLPGQPKLVYRGKTWNSHKPISALLNFASRSQVKLQRFDKPPADNGVLLLSFQHLRHVITPLFFFQLYFEDGEREEMYEVNPEHTLLQMLQHKR